MHEKIYAAYEKKKNGLNHKSYCSGYKEQTLHFYLECLLGVTVFFMDAYCLWQQDGVGNTHKLVRQYIPKGIDQVGHR